MKIAFYTFTGNLHTHTHLTDVEWGVPVVGSELWVGHYESSPVGRREKFRVHSVEYVVMLYGGDGVPAESAYQAQVFLERVG